MRLLITIILISSLFSCKQENSTKNNSTVKTKTAPSNTTNFDWVLGDWVRMNDEEGKTTYESWNKASEIKYIGHGYTMAGADTISQEIMIISREDENWNISVKLPGDVEFVVFKVISNTDKEFVCENKENDFPNIIKYWIDGKILKASIANDEMEIPFEFKKRIL